MKIQTNKGHVLYYIIFTYYFFILINSQIVFDIGNNAQLAFSKSHTSSTNTFNSKSTFCPNIAFSGRDDCPHPCSTSGNISAGCPLQNNNNTSNLNCPNIATTGPTYTDSNGCKLPCPSSGNIPIGCTPNSKNPQPSQRPSNLGSVNLSIYHLLVTHI